MEIYIFAYGSLMNPRSVAKTLPGGRASFPAILRGYRRKTNAPFDGYAYMNIIEEEGASVDGIIIPISPLELATLKEREEGYEQVDVTNKIDSPVKGMCSHSLCRALQIRD